MKVLIVCSINKGRVAPFISDQAKALVKSGVETNFVLIKGKGIIGYIKNYPKLIKAINQFKPELIHAHYGLSGLFANLQRIIPVVTTFHGSDINTKKVLVYSRIVHYLSSTSIVVSEKLKLRLNAKKKIVTIPCGVDLRVFNNKYPNKHDKILPNSINILFSSSFSNKVKNYEIASKACSIVEKQINKGINLIELKDFSRMEVAHIMNNVDCLLLTSFSEGSPQFIKEGMACNRPIVATNVGDIEWIFGNEQGHFLTSLNQEDVAEKIKIALDFNDKYGETNGRKRIIHLGLSSDSISNKIVSVYKKIILNNK